MSVCLYILCPALATEHILTKFTPKMYVELKNEHYNFFNMKTNLYFGQKHQNISLNPLHKTASTMFIKLVPHIAYIRGLGPLKFDF